MSKVCELTGKRPVVGNKVSHSNRKTKRRFEPNLKDKKFYVPETDEWVTMRVSMSALRTVSKMGLFTYRNKMAKKARN
jgi:large subunit ribosomal protein L28